MSLYLHFILTFNNQHNQEDVNVKLSFLKNDCEMCCFQGLCAKEFDHHHSLTRDPFNK